MRHVIEYPAAKTGWYPRISPKWYHPIVKTSVRYDKSRWESVLWLLQKKGDIFLFIKFVSENTQKHTSHASFSQLFVHNFSRSLENIWRIINTVASILEQIMSADKHPYRKDLFGSLLFRPLILLPFLQRAPLKWRKGTHWALFGQFLV